MIPWTLGGRYDRPIPRRMVEEAGVPRELFGHRKMKTAPWSPAGFGLSSPACDRDFDVFFQTKVANHTGRYLAADDSQRVRKRKINRQRVLRKLMQQLPVRIRRSFIWDRLDPRWGAKHLYRFHWGFERTQPRYQKALDRTAAARPDRWHRPLKTKTAEGH